MKRYVLALAAVAVCCLSFGSCIFDPKKDDGPPPPPKTQYQDLSKRDHVLENLQKAYNEKNLNQYERILDNGFIFHFSPADISKGKVQVTQWGRDGELKATANIFNTNYQPPQGDPVSSISLSLTWPAGDDNWTVINDPDPINYPGETWYEMTVSYVLEVKAGSTTYTSGGPIDASFVVRQSVVEGEPHAIWRIMIQRDDIGGTI